MPPRKFGSDRKIEVLLNDCSHPEFGELRKHIQEAYALTKRGSELEHGLRFIVIKIEELMWGKGHIHYTEDPSSYLLVGETQSNRYYRYVRDRNRDEYWFLIGLLDEFIKNKKEELSSKSKKQKRSK